MENEELQTSTFLAVLDSNLPMERNLQTIVNFVLAMPVEDKVEMLLYLKHFVSLEMT
jgi:hypothetical protein